MYLDDKSLFFELLATPSSKPFGVTLLPSVAVCFLCGSNLQPRRDRPASVTVYDDSVGTIPGSHFHKICKNHHCGYTQYYGYYTLKGSTQTFLVKIGRPSLILFPHEKQCSRRHPCRGLRLKYYLDN